MKTLFLFPGYGSQYVGMGKEFYDTYRLMQEYFEVASSCLNSNFVKLCFASSEAELRYIQNVYAATLLVHASIAAILIQEGIVPSAVAGFADGEYPALVTAGALNLPDALYLASKYSLFFDEYLQSVAVLSARIQGVSKEQLLAFCVKASRDGEYVSIAIEYGAQEYGIAGTEQAVLHVAAAVEFVEGTTVSPTKPGVGLYSILMDSIKEKIKLSMEKVDFKTTSIPLLSGLDAQFISNAADIKMHMLDQLISPFLCDNMVKAMQPYDLIVQIGNNSLFHDIIKAHFPQKTVVTIKKNSDIQMLKALFI